MLKACNWSPGIVQVESKDLLETYVQKVVAMVHQAAWGLGAAIQGLCANSFAEIQGQCSLGDHDDTDVQFGRKTSRWGDGGSESSPQQQLGP